MFQSTRLLSDLTSRVALADFHNKIPSYIARTNNRGMLASRFVFQLSWEPFSQVWLHISARGMWGWGWGWGRVSVAELGVNRCGGHVESPERPRCIFIVEKLESSKREGNRLSSWGIDPFLRHSLFSNLQRPMAVSFSSSFLFFRLLFFSFKMKLELGRW